jgi:crotonobetaine/carnitine-CoA ligase
LLTLEGVRDAAVLGVPSLLYDQDVLAVVVPNSGVSLPPREVLEACQKKLSGFKVPRYVQVVANIPRTQTFKVDMRSLLQLVATSERWYDRSESGITDIPEMLRRFLTDPEGLPRTSASQE